MLELIPVREIGKMRDIDKTKEQLIGELAEMRQRVTELDASETERKQTQEALRESEEKYRRMFELCPIGITTLDMKGMITSCNPAVYQKGGYSEGELVGKHFSKIAPLRVTDIPKFIKMFASIVRGKTPKPFEISYNRKDGTIGWSELHVGLVGAGGKKIGVQVLQRDITERKRAEEALWESEEKFYKAFHSSANRVAILSLMAGRYLDVNESFTRQTGYSREETIGRTVFEVARWVKEEERKKAVQMLWEDGTVRDLEAGFRSKSGEVLVGLFSAEVVNLSGEQCVIVSVNDITERKQAEEALQISRNFLENLTNSMWDAVFSVKMPERVIEWANDSFRLTGYEPEECVGKTTRFLYPSEEGFLTFGNKLRKAIAEGKDVLHTEQPLKRKNGEVFPAEITTTIFREKGEPTKVTSIVRDITERKQAEMLYKSLTDSSPTAIYISQAGKLVFVNPRFQEGTGLTEVELLGRDATEFVHPDDRKRARENTVAMLKGNPVSPYELRVTHKSGKTAWFVGTVNLINYKGERAILGNFTDIDERKKAEEDRRQLEQRAHLMSRLASIGEMAAGIAHEINNPLTTVIGFAELLGKKKLPDDIRKNVEFIHRDGQRIATIIDRLLTFARRQTSAQELVNINDIIENSLALQAYELKTNNIKITKQLAPDLPQTTTDAGQLQQVFLNIIMNAKTEMILAHGEGKLVIKTAIEDNTILISFKDDGPGITKQNLEKVFNPFFTTREVGKGTGLGLSVCHGIITEHGGQIYAKSRLGKGATFVVELPVVTQAKQLELAELDAGEAKKIAGVRILAVDDEPVVLDLLDQYLTDEGYEIETVDNASDALQRINGGRYSLILLDIKMVGMSGIELYRLIQKRDRSWSRRVIFITGDVMTADTRSFLSRTRAPHITKPFNLEELKKNINRMLTQEA